MAFLSARLSRGKKYWSICESRRVNGKPKNIPIEYLGTVDTLFKKEYIRKTILSLTLTLMGTHPCCLTLQLN